MDPNVVVGSKRRILTNVMRGVTAYTEGHPALAVFFFRRAIIELQQLIRKIETEEK